MTKKRKRKLRKYPRATKGLVRDVKGASKVGKKILNQKTPKKFKVPNIKLVKSYGRESKL